MEEREGRKDGGCNERKGNERKIESSGGMLIEVGAIQNKFARGSQLLKFFGV